MLPLNMEPLYMASPNMVKTMPLMTAHPLKMPFGDGASDYDTVFKDWPPKLGVQHFASNDTPLTPPTRFIQFVGGIEFLHVVQGFCCKNWLLLYV